mgnify:CR=1 FL=1
MLLFHVMLTFLTHGTAIFTILTLSQVLNGDLDMPVAVPFEDIKFPCFLTIGFLAVHILALSGTFYKTL